MHSNTLNEKSNATRSGYSSESKTEQWHGTKNTYGTYHECSSHKTEHSVDLQEVTVSPLKQPEVTFMHPQVVEVQQPNLTLVIIQALNVEPELLHLLQRYSISQLCQRHNIRHQSHLWRL